MTQTGPPDVEVGARDAFHRDAAVDDARDVSRCVSFI